MSLWLTEINPVELRANATEEELQEVIRAVYKQVLGNQHILAGDRLTSAESLLREGDMTVRGFVRLVAQSELYRSLFFEPCSQYRFIELNCKHLLGRAPTGQTEIARHVLIYNENGYEAEIDSYVDSEEYLTNFGENIVPYPRAQSSQTGIANVTFNRSYSLERGFASSDSSQKAAKLVKDLAANLATPIVPPVLGGGTPGNTNKRFRITATQSGGAVTRRSVTTSEVSYSQLSQTIQNIHRRGGKITSIVEVD
ncbi:MAG: photosystem I reaction center subunit XII [Cyanobacteria bacterium J083]|nr:MAG: photosystem I reaction center subunit XII [Cyanobacteria bacterium J083]